MSARNPSDFHRLFPRYVLRDGDIDSVLTLYDPQAVFCNRTGELRAGEQALRRELAPFTAARAEFDFRIRREIRAGDIALVHNEWSVRPPQASSGYAIEVFRRQADGTWRLLIGDPFTVRARLEVGHAVLPDR
jgi:ketosteroid isomerase-like protein